MRDPGELETTVQREEFLLAGNGERYGKSPRGQVPWAAFPRRMDEIRRLNPTGEIRADNAVVGEGVNDSCPQPNLGQ